MVKRKEKDAERFFSDEEFLKELHGIAWGEVTAVIRDGRIAVIRVVQTKQKVGGDTGEQIDSCQAKNARQGTGNSQELVAFIVD